MPIWPVPSASSVGGDIQLRTTLAVPRVNSQPNPRPLAHPMTAMTASDSTPSPPQARRNAFTPAPQRRARATAPNPSANSDGSFTCDDRVINTAPSSNIPNGPQADHSAG